MKTITGIGRHKHSHAVSAPAIQVKGLSLRYDGQPALEDLSFQVNGGDRVAVVGPNGAGKSSLFQVLAGVLAPSKGSILIHGHQPNRHLCTAYVTQSRQIDWNFPVTVEDVVLMGRAGLLGYLRRPGPTDHTAVQEALDQVGIRDLAGRQIRQLSGGQKQRMFIAQALAQEADLVLLDEPFAGLDIRSQDDIFAMLDELKEQGITVLVATHDLNLAAEHFNQTLLLKKSLIAFGPEEDVLTQANLEDAYGGRVQVLDTEEGRQILGDMGGHHAHDEEGPLG